MVLKMGRCFGLFSREIMLDYCRTACKDPFGSSTAGTCQGSNCSGQKWHEAPKDGCWGHITDLILKPVFPKPGALSGVAWPGLVEC